MLIMKTLVLIVLLALFFFVLGCAIPENPSACNVDSDCVGYIHPFGAGFGEAALTKQCASNNFLSLDANSMFKLDSTINCECVSFGSSPIPLWVFGMDSGKVCRNKDINWS